MYARILWRATNFPFPPSDLQFSDNYTHRPFPRHRSDILSWLHWPAFGHASTQARVDTGEVGIEKAKMAVETPTNCFRGISKNYDPSTLAVDAFPLCTLLYFLPFSFPFFSPPLISFPCSIERTVVTFEICWEEEKRLGSKGRMI